MLSRACLLALTQKGFIPGLGLSGFIDVEIIASGQELTHAFWIQPVEDPPMGEIPFRVIGVRLVIDVIEPVRREHKIGREIVDMPTGSL